MPLVRTAFKLRAHVPLGAFARDQLRAAQERGDALAKADAYELQARVDELRGDTPATVAALEHALHHDPTRLDLAHQVACEYAATGQYGKLFDLRASALERIEAGGNQATIRDRIALLFDSATLATADKRSDELVAKLYHRVLELDRRNRLALFHLEAIVRAAKAFEPQAALEEHIASVQEDPHIRAVFLTRSGETLADGGKREEAVQRFARAVELQPAYLPALESWSETALAGELWTELAEAATRKASLGGPPADVGALHHLAGVALMDRARAKDAATASLRRALEAMPHNLDALLRLRILLEHTPQREVYAGLVRRRLELETDRTSQLELHRMLAEHHRYSGMRDDAIREYRAMLAINPADVRAHAAIADISTDQSDWRTVADAVGARIPLEKDVQVLRTLHYRLGLLYAEHEIGAAVQSFQRALTYRPDDSETLVRLTDLAIGAGLWEVAVGACDRLVTGERDPAILATHLHRAAVIFMRGFADRERAERMLRLAVDSAPASPDTTRLLVAFYQEVGDAAALHAQLDRIIEAMHVRIDGDPLDGAAYLALSRAVLARAATADARAIARSAAELAQVLGVAGEQELRLLAEEPVGDPNRLVGPGADDALFAGAGEPRARELLRRLAEPIAKHVGADVGVHAVGRKERVRAPHPAAVIGKAIATTLGFKDVEVYVSARYPYAMAAEPTNPVSLVVGEAIAAGSPAVLRFAAGAALKLAQLSLAIPSRLSTADLAAIATAAWRVATPEITGGVDPEIVQGHLQKLRKLVGGNLLADARPLASSISGINAPALARDLKIAGLRAGLAASGSVVAALSVVAGAVGGSLQSVLSDPIGRGLVSFCLGEHRPPQ
jgi:tetratricopeptide (TPR) repeat protein